MDGNKVLVNVSSCIFSGFNTVFEIPDVLTVFNLTSRVNLNAKALPESHLVLIH